MDGGRKCCDRQTCPTQKQQLPSSEKMFTPRQWSQQSSRQDAMQHPSSQPSTRSAERSCPARYANARNNSTQILFVEPNFMETPSHANNQTQTGPYRNNEYLDETQETSSPFCCIARPKTNNDTSAYHKPPEKPCSPKITQPKCSNRSERVMPQSHYPTNYNYTPDCGGASSKTPFECTNTYDRVECGMPTSFAQSADDKQEKVCPSTKSQDDKCVCEGASAQKKKNKRCPFSCLRSRDDVPSLTQSQEYILQAKNAQSGLSSVDISPERYRPCGNSVPAQRQLECESDLPRQQEGESVLPTPEQICSCENSDEIPYERNLALHYEKCTEQPPVFATQPLPCNCPQLENRELQSEPSGYQVPSELIESNYYEQRPVCTPSPSKLQTCSCKYPKEPCVLPPSSYVPTSTPACQNFKSQLKKCPRRYHDENSREQIRCISSYSSYTPIPATQPCQNNCDEQRPAQPAYTPAYACSICKRFEETYKESLSVIPTQTASLQPQVKKCPYCSAIEEQQQHQQQLNICTPTRSCQETSHMPVDFNCHGPLIACPQDSENSSHGTTPCTYPTTDTETQESSTMSAKPIRAIIGCSYLSDEVFYSLSSESSEQDLTLCGRKNRQIKKHKKHGKTESKARNIVILQLLHEVVHLISDDENTKTHPPPVKRKIRNISAIGNDEADIGAFSSRTNLSSIKITILPGQAGSAPVSRQCTEGSETAANMVQPSQSIEVCYPMSGPQAVPCNLFIAPNLTCSNPNCNSKLEMPTATFQQGKYSQAGLDKQNFFKWNPGTETINYAMEELQPNAEVICEPEIIEPDDQCNVCVESRARAPCKDQSSDRYQGDDRCDCFESSVQQPQSQSNKQKPTTYDISCDCFEPSAQRPKSNQHNSTVFDDSCDCFGPIIQLPDHKTCDSAKDRISDRNQCADCFEPAVLKKEQESTTCAPQENHSINDGCDCSDSAQPAVTQLNPCHKPRSVNTDYAYSSCNTTSSGEIGDRPRRSNRLQFLSMTPIDVRTEMVSGGEETCDCECDCHEQKEECPINKEQIDDCCENREDECECEIEKEKSREKTDYCGCDCCHCKAMRANANVCNTIATPQQVLNDGGVTEMKYFIDSIIMDLDAMEAARRSKLGPQRSRQPSICPRQSFPVTIMDVTDLGSSSLYVKWSIHDCYGIGGYEIYVDGHLTNRYFHCNHEAAVICDIDVTEPHKIVLLAQPKIDDNFDDFCSEKNDNKMDLVRKKCKSLLKRDDQRIPPDSNKAVNALWTPSIYYYDPVNRKADCSKPKVYNC